jgi:N6-adenosine-specific RNA methylase IME4
MPISHSSTTISVTDIRIGPRYRKDLGDIEALARSIDQIGLLQPIVIRPDNTLVAGARRLAACRMLGWQHVPIYVAASLDDELRLLWAERDENTCRLDFAPTEAVAIGRTIEECEREAAKERMTAGINQYTEPCGNLPQGEIGKTRDKVGAALGMSGKTYEKAKAVVEAAEEDPDTYGDLPELMDAESISAATREMKRRQQVSELEAIEAKQAKAVAGVYDAIVIDPPWPMEKIERDVRPNQAAFDYPTMTEEELGDLTIPTADSCHVWLWTTHRFLPMALRLLDRWGLKYVCTFVWHKPGGFQPIGLPQYNCEFCLYARKGSPAFIDTKAFPVCFEAPRGAHSEKPEAFYDVVRRVTAGLRLDMFNRRHIEGFDTWGKEAAA